MRSPERAGTLAWKRRRIALFPAQVSEGQARTLASKERQCVANLDRGVYNSRVCFDLLDDVVADSGSRSRARVSMYDVGRWEPPGAEFPPGHKALERYLNVRAVRRAIHVTHTAAFLECTDPPYDALSSRDGVGVSAELAAVLDDPRRTVRVLFFNGVRDLVCNHLRTETVLEKLAWAGANSYARSGKQVWYVGSSAAPAGYVKNAYGQLTYLAVLDSGHMVPMDAPARALDMIDRFVRGASLGDASQSISTTAGGADPGCAPAPRPTPRPSGRPTPGPTPRPTAAPAVSAAAARPEPGARSCTADCLRDARVQAVLALPPVLCLALAAVLAVCVRCFRARAPPPPTAHAPLAQDSDDEDARGARPADDGLDAQDGLKPHPGAEVL